MRLLDKEELIILAQKVAQQYAHTIPTCYMEDVVMSMVANFTEQSDRIREGFRGQSKETTYIIAILNRQCCSIIRKEIKHWSNSGEEHTPLSRVDEDINAESACIIKDEAAYLRKILILFNDRFKTVIFWAFFYSMRAKKRYVQCYDPDYKVNRSIERLTPQPDITGQERFIYLATIVEKIESRKIKGDAVRMWFKKQQRIVIKRLNSPYNRANYDKESLEILFELFYKDD